MREITVCHDIYHHPIHLLSNQVGNTERRSFMTLPTLLMLISVGNEYMGQFKNMHKLKLYELLS